MDKPLLTMAEVEAAVAERMAKAPPKRKGQKAPRNKQPKPAPASEITEDSAALDFAGLHRDQLRFDHDAGAWFCWTGSHWRREGTKLALEWARQLARRLSEDATAKGRYRKTAFASGVERFARGDRAFAVTADYWDRDPMLLGTPRGTVDLRTGKLRPADPDDAISKVTLVAPTETTDCPRFLAFLNEATGDDQALIRFLQQFCGYCLTGSVQEHALVFIYGDGGNGKGVFLNTVTSILGDHATTATMDALTVTSGERHTTDVAMLRGARIVTASETEEGRAWAEARIKQMTGGDPITARFMRQNNFTFLPAFKLMIIGNHKPTLHNVDEAARRRFNIVPFTRTPAKPDPKLEAKLRPEAQGILRWMIDGCLDWQANGLVRPRTVIEATSEYFANQDTFGQWLDEECDVEPGNRWKNEASAALFKSWQAYATSAGDKPGSRKAFADGRPITSRSTEVA
jgi:putative DNA primase/helicase